MDCLAGGHRPGTKDRQPRVDSVEDEGGASRADGGFVEFLSDFFAGVDAEEAFGGRGGGGAAGAFSGVFDTFLAFFDIGEGRFSC